MSDTHCAIGLDVGGTKIAGGVVTFPSGQLLMKAMQPTAPQRGGVAVLTEALDLTQWLLTEARRVNLTPMGVGVGLCELVDLDGRVTSGHTVAWQGLPVQARFASLAPARIESDVRAHALAEAAFGAGQGYRQFVFVTIGTGISCCWVQDGRPHAGAQGNALILASSPLTTTCSHCGIVLHPILEEFASGPAIVARYNAQTTRTMTRAEEVLAAIETGDAIALDVVRSAGEAVGVSVGWLVNVLDPEAVIVGGGLGSAPGVFWESLVGSARAHIWSDESRAVPIVPAALGPDAGMIGAATALARQLNLAL
jgi:glucokinase